MLELYGSLFSLAKVNNVVPNISKIEAINFTKKHANSNNYHVKIQALMLQIFIEESDESFINLKGFLLKEIDHLSFEIIGKIVPSLLNYCTIKIDKGDERYFSEYYSILNSCYDRGSLFKIGVFSVFRLITYIKTTLMFNTIEKAEHLLEESLKVISPAQKESFQYLIESRIAFAKQDYKLALRKISIINPSDSIYYYPQYKIMLIKCYIMLADIDRLMAERENFYKYIHGHKNIQEDEKRRHKLFIKYTEYLTIARYDYLTDYMKKRIEHALLQTSPYFTEKIWVRERWEELKVSNS